MRRFIGNREIAGLCALTLAVLLCCTARGESNLTIEADDWSWEEGMTTTFQGEITVAEDVPDAELTLSVETRLEDSGEVVFTEVNGTRLKIRKRSATVDAELKAGEAFPFTAEWTAPEEIDGEIAWAAVHLTVKDGADREIASMQAEIGSRAQDAAVGVTPAGRVGQATLILAILCAAVWTAAILRNLVLRKKA